MSENKIRLDGVRLSFASIFHKAVFEGQEGKYEGTFLLDKDNPKHQKLHAKLEKAIQAAMTEAKVKVPKSKWALRDGDEIFEEKEYDGYENTWAIKAGNGKRPTIIDRDRTPLTEDDPNAPYSGCYVNAIIDFWVQDNKWGKRVNANLYGVQFNKDGEAFGNGPVDVTDDFDDLDDEL